MTTIYTDFETQSIVDLTEHGSYNYSKHYTTRVNSVCVCNEHGDTLLSWSGGADLDFPAQELYTLYASADQIMCHNNFFEYCIYNHCLVRLYGIPPILDWAKWGCTKALAQTHALPGKLEFVAKALQLEQKKSDATVMRKMSRPRSITFEGPVWWKHDTSLQDYCDQDVLVTQQIHSRLGDMPSKNRTIHLMTCRMNYRGIKIDYPYIQRIRGLIGIERDKLIITGRQLGVDNAKSVQQMLTRLRYFNLSLPNIKAETVKEALLLDDLVPEARTLLELRQAVGNSSTSKYDAMVRLRDPANDRVHDMFVYHGASTGRWSSVGVQLQNLPRGAKDYESLRSLIYSGTDTQITEYLEDTGQSFNRASVSLVRSAFIPEKGKFFLDADYAQIETRVLYWLAGTLEDLEIMKKGFCIYKHMAGKIFNIPDPQSISGSDSRRQIAKALVLGLGYGMGPSRFSEENNMPLEDAEKYVNFFRREIDPVTGLERPTPICRLWKRYSSAAEYAVRSKKEIHVCRCTFRIEGEFLTVTLPSTRKLYYYKPHMFEGQVCYFAMDSQTRQFARTHTYGGKITENIVQAIAFDITAEAMLRLEIHGYPIVLSAHDEVLAEVKTGQGSLEELIEIMVDAPSWTEGIPLKAEGWEGDHYRKT